METKKIKRGKNKITLSLFAIFVSILFTVVIIMRVGAQSAKEQKEVDHRVSFLKREK